MAIRRIGYPCIRVNGDRRTVKTCQLKNARPERLRELIDRNFTELRKVLEFNLSHGIKFFRIHSDTIPFASHPDVAFDWLSYSENHFQKLGSFIKENNVRISMHPGVYTVLNSPDEEVLQNTIENLNYHAEFLGALGLSNDAKFILHIGGVYNDKQNAIERFCEQIRNLSETVCDRLVIENDESNYDVREVLDISGRTGLPVVFDWLHHQLNRPDDDRSVDEWMSRCFETWDDEDGVPIVHFSSASGRAGGHHADFIDPERFDEFHRRTESLNSFDVMLECKEKEEALFRLREYSERLE